MSEAVIKAMKQRAASCYMNGSYYEAIAIYNDILRLPLTQKCKAEVLRDLAQTYYVTGGVAKAIQLINASLSMYITGEKAFIIALKCAIDVSDWHVFMACLDMSMSSGFAKSSKIDTFVRNANIPRFIRDAANHHVNEFKRGLNHADQLPYNQFPQQKLKIMDNKGEMVQNITVQCVESETSQSFSKRVNSPQKLHGTSKTAHRKERTQETDVTITNGSNFSKEDNHPSNSQPPCEVVEDKFKVYTAICKEAASCQNKIQRLQLYQEALTLALVLTSQVPDSEVLDLRFLVSELQLEKGEYPMMEEAIRFLKMIEPEHGPKFPAVYVSLAHGFALLYRFEIGGIWVHKGKYIIETSQIPEKRLYPQTDITIAHTCREEVIKRLEELKIICMEHHPRDGVCRYEHCDNVNTNHIAPSRDIFYSAPDFDGCTTLICYEHCEFLFHPICWKAWKSSKEDILKIGNRAILGLSCPTPDCKGSIKELIFTDKSGQIKSRVCRKERDCGCPQWVQAKEKKSKSNGKSAETSVKISSGNGLNSQVVLAKDTVKSNNSEAVMTVLNYPPKKIISKTSQMVQTESPAKCMAETQTKQDKTFLKLGIIEKQMDSLSKKHEKLREKYMTLKNREDAMERRVAKADEARFILWKAAGEEVIANRLLYVDEKVKILNILLQLDGYQKSEIEKVLFEWRKVLSDLTDMKTYFHSSSEITPQSDVLLEMPHLPPYPIDALPTLLIVSDLANATRSLEKRILQQLPIHMAPYPQMMYGPILNSYEMNSGFMGNLASFNTVQPPIPMAGPSGINPLSGVLENANFLLSNPTAPMHTTSEKDNRINTSGAPVQPGSNLASFNTVQPPIPMAGPFGINLQSEILENKNFGSSNSINPMHTTSEKDNRISATDIPVQPDSVLPLQSEFAASKPPIAERDELEAGGSKDPERNYSSSVISNESTSKPRAQMRTPSKSKKKAKGKRTLSCSSIASSVASDDFGIYDANDTVYYKLIEYLAVFFPNKSENELRRCLCAVQKKNDTLFEKSNLSEIVAHVLDNLQSQTCRSEALIKFNTPAWTTTSKMTKAKERPFTPSNEDCCICLCSLQTNGDVRKLQCSHVFHLHCVKNWHKFGHSCPICREHVILHEEFPVLQ